LHNLPIFAANLLQIFEIFKEKDKKMHFFCIFFQKNLVNSKKSSTFAPAFDREQNCSRKTVT